MKKQEVILYGLNSTERWFDAESYDEATYVNLPHEEAVEDAKNWVEDNEL